MICSKTEVKVITAILRTLIQILRFYQSIQSLLKTEVTLI